MRDPMLRAFPGDPLTSPEVVLMLALASLYASFMFFSQVGADGRPLGEVWPAFGGRKEGGLGGERREESAGRGNPAQTLGVVC